MISFSLEV